MNKMGRKKYHHQVTPVTNSRNLSDQFTEKIIDHIPEGPKKFVNIMMEDHFHSIFNINTMQPNLKHRQEKVLKLVMKQEKKLRKLLKHFGNLIDIVLRKES